MSTPDPHPRGFLGVVVTFPIAVTNCPTKATEGWVYSASQTPGAVCHGRKGQRAGASGQAAGHIVSAAGKQGAGGAARAGGDRDRERGRRVRGEKARDSDRDRGGERQRQGQRDQDRQTDTQRETERGGNWCSAFSLLFTHPRTVGKHSRVRLSFWKHLPDPLTAMLPW